MNRRQFLAGAAGALVVGGRAAVIRGQASATRPDLAALADGHGFTLVNRAAARLADGARTGVRLSTASGEGLALIPGTNLVNGTIEIELRGKDVPQQSFLGVVFHAADGSSFDTIYFRPFNFRAADPASRAHAVQYHAQPGFTWDKLRAEQPGKFEQAVSPVPDPNGWFHARIVVADPMVRVFVADARVPCLAVSLLTSRRSGLVGLWVGNNSGGDFANLSLTPA
jgi:hypothetical protein